MKPIRFGVVGTNFVLGMFMKGIEETSGVEVVAVCSGRKENALRFAQQYDVALVYDSFQDMAMAKTIDAVYIATPNVMHFEQAAYFLERHIPVFLEKPMVVNDVQAKQLFQIAKENNTYLHDGLVPLYSDNLSVLRDALRQIGQVRRVVISMQQYSSRYAAYLRGENPTTFRKELANGAFMDLGIYTVACAVALFGKPSHITSSAQLLETGVDGLNTAILHYPNFNAILMNSKITNSQIVSEIQGEFGNIQIKSASTLSALTLTLHNEEPRQLDVSKRNPFHFQLVDFMSSIHNHKMESTKAPHQLSIDILETLTLCRLQSGVIYNEDA